MIQELCKLHLLTRVTLVFVDDYNHGCELLPLPTLSALTNLTSLRVVDWAGAGLDDTAVVAITTALTRLQELHLSSNSMQTWDALPTIGKLTGLHRLVMQTLSCLQYEKLREEYYTKRSRYDADNPNGEPNTSLQLTLPMLQQLSALTSLTMLELCLSHLDAEQQQEFLAVMPSLTRKDSVVDLR
jgi:hypothetical protein